MPEWTDDQEFSGRRVFDRWRFSEVDRLVPWDWADMSDGEKRHWINRAVDEKSRAA